MITAWSTDPKPEALRSRFLFSDGSALPFHQGTLRRKVLAAIVLCQEHPEVPTAGLAPSSVLAKILLASDLFLAVMLVSLHPLLLMELGSSSIALSLDRDLPSFS